MEFSVSGGITESTVDEIKSRVELSDLISSYGVQIRIAGSSKKACCPFHNEKTPSFVINDSKGFYHCFGCGESGDVIKFVQKMDGLTFVEAVKKLADQCGIAVEANEKPEDKKRKRLYALMAELAQFYRRCLLKTKEAEIAREYLKKRDLGDDVQEAFLIGYAPLGIVNILKWAEKYGYTVDELESAGVVKAASGPHDKPFHRFGGRLMFAVKDKRARVVAFSGRQLVESKNSGKYVNSPETAIFKKSNVLFGFDKAAGNITKSPHHEAIVCEGQIDTIRLHASGFPVAVASQGTAFTQSHVAMLTKAADQVTLVFDDDAAGRKAAIRTARLFLEAETPVRVVTLPEGEDPDSFLRKYGRDDFAKLLDNAKSIIEYQVLIERSKERNPQSLDAVARISRSVIETIAQSKSAVLRASMVNEAAKLLNLPAVAISEELQNFISRQNFQSKSTVRAPLPEEDFEDEIAGDEIAQDDFPISREEGFEAQDADSSAIPPPRELALCEFLLANENDEILDAMIGDFLPENILTNDFTRGFVRSWRAAFVTGEDVIVSWSSSLSSRQRAWFDSLLLGQSKSVASTLSVTDIMQDFIRTLWADHLKRLRGALPIAAGAEGDLKRMKISMDLKRINSVKWHTVKELIIEWQKEGV
jgi:DNA primase